MSYKGDQCGTGLCTTPAPTACSTVRHVHEVHTYEVVPRKTRKRLPWMQAWSANCVPYKAGSLVIHCNEYWYNLCETYSPPDSNGDWHVFDPEEFFRWYHENARGSCNTLTIPVYDREISCAVRDDDPYCAGTQYKLWLKGDVVTGGDGKVYVSLVDNNATFPPNTGWSEGRYLIDIVRGLVLKSSTPTSYCGALLAGSVSNELNANPVPTPGTNFTFTPFTATQNADVFVENWWTGLLGRASDPVGKSFWVSRFKASATSTELVDTAKAFVTAALNPVGGGAADAALLRSMDDSRFVSVMFNAFLGRNGDIPGVQYWAGVARAEGRDQMIPRFLANGEFAVHAGSVRGNG